MSTPDAYTKTFGPCDGEFSLTIGGDTYVVANECTHRKGLLYHGIIDPVRRTIRCPLHQTLFDLRTGKKLAGPACEDLHVRKL